MVKEYRVTKPALLFMYLIMMCFFIFSIFIIFNVILDPAQEARWFAILWIIGVYVFLIPFGLRTPYKIIYDDSTEEITFKSLVFEKKYDINELKSIKTSFGNSYYICFNFWNRKLRLINNVDGMYELINELKNINKNIETKGC